MQAFTPSERVLVAVLLFQALGRARLNGAMHIWISNDLTLHFNAEQIQAILEKLEIFQHPPSTLQWEDR